MIILRKICVLFAFNTLTSCIDLDTSSFDSIKNATSTIAKGLLDYYTGDQYGRPVGLFTQPYYWWESGGAWGSMLDYWWYTEDDQYNDLIKEALLSQVGLKWDYVPLNQSTTEGNDDQAFWGLAVMAAAERNFSNPEDDEPQWLYLAQAVFNTMAFRWDETECGGGLRWQIFKWNSGYDYKNTVSNGCFFHLAARLARFTSNNTYLDWAEKTWDWMNDTQLIDGNDDYLLAYDGVSTTTNCTKVVASQWTYNAGLMLSGAAYIYNYTESEIWSDRMNLLLEGVSVFFREGIMFESQCQSTQKCNNDQRSFKAFLSRFLGLTAQLVPETRDIIDWYLDSSAKAAAESCSGGSDGVTCGLDWQRSDWDGYYGLGEQMCALEVIQNLRYQDKPPPYTENSGASSPGNPAAGNHLLESEPQPLNTTAGSQAAAAMITVFISLTIILGALIIII